jgi:hypothetical protein
MNFSLPPGTVVVLPVSQLDKIRRYNECIANFACEIRGRDVERCIKAISPMTHELEDMKDGSYRVHKPTEPQARLIQQQVINWVGSSPENREVQSYPVSTDHTSQQAKDACNPSVSGTTASSILGGFAMSGGPWGVTTETAPDGSITAVHFHGPGHKKAQPVPTEVVKQLDSAPKAEAPKAEAQKVVESASVKTKTDKVAEAPARTSRSKTVSHSRKRPTKNSK